ncbi:MAG: stage II sporulation protein M [Planctomycetota bacterium]|jgi:uncharacterized membrane protein SpoIIM required for sporulation
MDLTQFLHHRQPRWQRLSELLDRVDKQGIENLSNEEANELFSLYRLVSSDLNLMQTRTGNPALLDFLEGLVGRAYAVLSVPHRLRPLRGWWRIVRNRFPAIIRAESSLVLLAAVVMAAGALFGFCATLVDVRSAQVFLAPFPGHAMEAPRARVERLEAMEREGETRVDNVGDHASFTTMLFTHNIRVTVLAFALGLTFGLGTVILLFYNGTILGSLAALYLEDGVITFFLAWVGPHGAIELPCIVFGAAAGLILARAQYRRDEGSLRQQLRTLRPRLVTLLIGTATLLVLAGVIEGGFSQVNEPTLSYGLKIAVAVVFFAGLMGYLFWMPLTQDTVDAEDVSVPARASDGT